MLRSYTTTNSNASSVQLMEPGTFSSLTKLDSTPKVHVYSKLNAIIHAFALSLEGFFLMGFEVLGAVLTRAEGFWRVNTLRWGLQ